MAEKECSLKDNPILGACRGSVTHVDHDYFADGHPRYACEHHVRALAQANPFGGYNWKRIKKED